MSLPPRILCAIGLFATLSCGTPTRAQPTDALTRAQTAYTAGDYETAINRLHQSAATDTSAHALYLLGRSHQALLQHEAALKALHRAYQLDSLSTPILQAQGRSYEVLSRLEDAEDVYARALAIAPSRALHLALAGLYHRMHAWKEATYHYRVLLQRDSTNSLLHGRLAQTLQAQAHRDEARAHYRQAHRLNPRNASVALSLSRLLEQHDEVGAAIRVIDSTLQYRDTASLWKRRAALAFQQDSLAAASHAYEKAIQLGDSTAATFRRLGIANVGRGRYPSALEALQTARDRDSTNVRTHFYLGIAYREVDSLQQATAAFDETIMRIADDILVDAYIQSATTYDAQKQLRRAIDAYKTALQVQPARVDIYFHLATLYDDYYRDKTTAAYYYRKFLTVTDSLQTPFHAYASSRLQQLRPVLHFQEGRAN